MNITVNLSEEEFEILEDVASENDVGISEYVRRALLEKLEDEDDIKWANAVYAEYVKNPVASPAEEVWKRLGV